MTKKVIVYHAYYSCESGCCGHIVELVDGRKEFDFVHPDGKETPLQFAKDLVERLFGPEHVADLDWENSQVSDD